MVPFFQGFHLLSYVSPRCCQKCQASTPQKAPKVRMMGHGFGWWNSLNIQGDQHVFRILLGTLKTKPWRCKNTYIPFVALMLLSPELKK